MLCILLARQGNPKVVFITHDNLLATYRSWESVYELTPDDNHLQMANVFFDVFTGDWVRALCSGGTLVLCPMEYLAKPEKLYAIINDQHITVAEFVPTTLNRLIVYLETCHKMLDTFRVLISGSDLWTIAQCKKAIKLCACDTKIYNSYGTTEATIDSTYFEVTAKSIAPFKESDLVPIGKPFPHARVKLLSNLSLHPKIESALVIAEVSQHNSAKPYNTTLIAYLVLNDATLSYEENL